jgi:hypothetical protein
MTQKSHCNMSDCSYLSVYFFLMKPPHGNSLKAVGNCSCVFITIDPYHAIRSLIGFPEISKNRAVLLMIIKTILFCHAARIFIMFVYLCDEFNNANIWIRIEFKRLWRMTSIILTVVSSLWTISPFAAMRSNVGKMRSDAPPASSMNCHCVEAGNGTIMRAY